MHDSQANLMPPTTGDFPPTPSGLTPNTRSEAEAALSHNALTQTESAAPTTPLPPQSSTLDGSSEAQSSYMARRPRASSTNFEIALEAARNQLRKQSTVDSTMSTDTSDSPVGGTHTTASPMATVPFPPPGQGVVPLHTGVGAGQAEAVKKARPTGMTLGALGRQASYSQQDMKHLYSAEWMKEPGNEDKGYGTGPSHKGAGSN